MVVLNVKKGKIHYFGYEISGHANYGECGKNIVCAAVSALEDAMINTLDLYGVSYNEQRNTEIPSKVSFQLQNEIVDVIFSVFLTGMVRIQEAYPECVKVEL